jgi:phage/plasmid-associated DNA primase
MEEEKFREYKYDDYISITCGYDWRDPTDEEINTINNLIKLIMPIDDERELYLQILCTSIDGRCLEKFIVFNGSGGNGKGMINDLLLLSLGQYGLLGNNGILFESSKTGSNPEKANLHKKRCVIFREPPEKHNFENSIIKELTGGGSFSARTHHEKETEKELNLTMIVECNKKPLFAEEPTNAEVRRIIDMYFRSTFTTDKKLIDEKNNIYLADPIYKTKEFQQKHKYAFMKILIDEHKKFYKQNKSLLQIPQSVLNRTQLYLEMSCQIVSWFKENFEETKNEKDNIKIKDIYNIFIKSEYYFNMSKPQKRKYGKTYFSEYVSSNIFFKKYYSERYNNTRNVLKGWKSINIEDNKNNTNTDDD